MRRWGARSPPLALPPGSRSDGGARISPPRGVPGGNAALRSASLLEELHFYFPSSLVESPPRIPISTARPGEAWEVWKHLPLPSADTTSSSILISTAPENRLRFLACWFYFVNPLHAEREGARGTPGGAQGSCPQNVHFPQQQSKAGLKTGVREVGEPFAIENTILWRLLPPGAAEGSLRVGNRRLIFLGPRARHKTQRAASLLDDCMVPGQSIFWPRHHWARLDQ